MLTPETVPIRSADVVTRRDEGGVLLFQVRTDEMHFISDAAFALLSLCDGSRTVAEIEELLARSRPELGAPEARASVEEFFESLAGRNVLELWR